MTTTFNKLMEMTIKEALKERPLYFNVRGLKVLNTKFVKTVVTGFDGNDGEKSVMTKYLVTCSMRAKKFDDNRIQFEVNLYDNADEGTIGVYYDGKFYEA